MKRRCTGTGAARAVARRLAVPLALLAALPAHADAGPGAPPCATRPDGPSGPACDRPASPAATPGVVVAGRPGADATAAPVPLPPERTAPQTVALMLGGFAAVAFVAARRRQD